MKGLMIILVNIFALSASAGGVNTDAFSMEFYRVAASRCEGGEEKFCSTLVHFCERSKDVKACFVLSYVVGLRGDDERGLKYLKVACDGGMLEACRHVPIIQNYIKEKLDANKVVL
jgi:hypothetical protein